MISEGKPHRVGRATCDLLDDDGHVIGKAYAYSSKNNDKFLELAWNTNDACIGELGTFHFDENGLYGEEE